ncbi:MAG: hypothetical protein M5U34_09385 [Chloroflexi bacterium]|nr:hypothetical protein [Chloroflexota bacterium]
MRDSDIRQGQAVAWLQINLIQGKLVAIIVYQAVLGRAASIVPTIVGDFCLQLVPIKLTISQKDDIAVFRQQGLDYLYQLAMCFLGKMPLLPRTTTHARGKARFL